MIQFIYQNNVLMAEAKVNREEPIYTNNTRKSDFLDEPEQRPL